MSGSAEGRCGEKRGIGHALDGSSCAVGWARRAMDGTGSVLAVARTVVVLVL